MSSTMCSDRTHSEIDICSNREPSRIRTSIAQQDKRFHNSIPKERLEFIEDRYNFDRARLFSNLSLPTRHDLEVLEHNGMPKLLEDTERLSSCLLDDMPAILKRDMDSKLIPSIVQRKLNIADASQIFNMESLGKDHFTLGFRRSGNPDVPIGIFPILDEKYPLNSDVATTEARIGSRKCTGSFCFHDTDFASRATGSTAASRTRYSKPIHWRDGVWRFTGSGATQPNTKRFQSQRSHLQPEQSDTTSRLDKSQGTTSQSNQSGAIVRYDQSQPSELSGKKSERAVRPRWRH